MAWLLEKIEPLWKTGQIPQLSDDWIQAGLNKPSLTFRPCGPGELHIGKFYFMMYNLTGKTSRLEQYNPILVIDYKIKQNVPIVWAVSLNFIPQKQRISFFNWFFDRQSEIVKKNESIESSKNQIPYSLTFDQLYESLDQIGYAHSIREWIVPKISHIWEIGIQDMHLFLTIDTEKFTGVDEKKLFEIWLAKLNDRDERKRRKITELNRDVTKIYKELSDNLLTLEERTELLKKSVSKLKS